MGFYIVLVIIIILMGVVISIYNTLVTLRLKVRNSEAQIDIQLKRRFDLIPNLVETVKGYAVHESKTLESVIAARNAYSSANSMGEKSIANSSLLDGLKNIFALAESYPELKANENFLKLQEELMNVEEKISFSRQFYNDAVEMYNKKTITFPNNIVASIFNFKEEEFFEITNLEERENIKVSFDDN